MLTTLDGGPHPAAESSEALRTLITQLWRPADGTATVRATLDRAPAGHRVVERYAVVPDPARARFLVPLTSRASAAASVGRYNGLRPPRTRAARALLGLGFRSGLAPLLMRRTLVISVPEDLPDASIGDHLLTAHLSGILGGVAAGISVREPDPNLKPILQLFRPDGQPAGFAKIGWNEATRRLVTREARATTAVRQAVPARLPELLHHGSWQGREVVVTAPLPPGIRRHADPDRPLDPRIPLSIAESTGIRTLSLAESDHWRRLATEAGGMTGEAPAAILAAMRRIEASHGRTRLRFGRWHGDWTPWNLGWDGQDLWIWDWEHSTAEVPVGFDLLHWRFQVAVAMRDLPLSDGVEAVRAAARTELDGVGVPSGERGLLAALYLLEMFVRTCRLEQGGGGWHSRIFPDVMLPVLREMEAMG
ncbi:hypothetical protein GCM10010156_47010 [Planobispora rosea]|uniref:Aminoglycoside phosphotransferase domain-containing protein n=1 Tax=Planobispora rosea TaxID=35762 RepID=A0A8J3WBR7_PLARO|nr:hypothetical protein [Planobispora rosea]GGS82944.1 hypothetical protein GCM10010156_47010 [Planobispora rosea]GIH84184.1 hypothetical protein Pro02_25920 [Planobispora rosea]